MEFRRLFIVFVVILSVGCQSPSVNPKLDFDGDNENSTDDGRQYQGGTSPKIHGVRVSLDTGESKKVSRESKESVEHTDGKGKKRVGIHTDITFEITGAGVAVTKNHTRNIEGEDEDASVPIFGGSRGRSTYRPRKPFDPKTYYGPNYSSERRSFTSDGSSGRRGYSGGVGRNTDEERAYYEPYRPASQTYGDEIRWKPCYCASSSQDRRRRSGGDVMKATSSVIQIVDDKLDGPFKRSQKRFREEV